MIELVSGWVVTGLLSIVLLWLLLVYIPSNDRRFKDMYTGMWNRTTDLNKTYHDGMKALAVEHKATIDELIKHFEQTEQRYKAEMQRLRNCVDDLQRNKERVL